MGKIDPTQHLSEYTLIGVGEHVFRAMSFERGTSAKGNDFIKVKFKCIDGPYKGGDLTEAFFTKDTAIGRLCGCLIKMGYTTPFDPDVDDDVADALVGRTVKIKVSHREYQKDGETRKAPQADGWDAFAPVDKGKFPDETFAPPDPSEDAGGDDSRTDDLPF